MPSLTLRGLSLRVRIHNLRARPNLSHKDLINLRVSLMGVLALISLTLVIEILVLKFLVVGEVETGTIGHMHFETPRSEALCLLLLNSCNFFFGMTDGTILFL